MRVNQFFTSTLAAASLLVASCSTQKLATNSADDVYNTTAQARVYKYAPPVQTAQIDTSRYDPNYKASNPEYDMDYASRIDRFYYGSPNRVYFDDYYNFYGYNSWYNPYDWSLGFNYGWGFNRWMNPFNSWAFYGSPYYWNTWGPYSYWGGGFGWRGGLGWGWGGGYWGGGGWGGNVIGRNDNYRARPTRGAENGIGVRPNGSIIDRGSRTGGNTVGIGRTGSRPEAYNPTTTTNGTSRGSSTARDSRPSRAGSNGGDYRPTRTTESSRPSYSPPPQSSSSGSSGRTGGSSGGSSSSGGGGGRPTRGGGR